MIRKNIVHWGKRCFAFCDRYSWAFGIAGVASAAIGGVIANATVGAFLKEACGFEGKACLNGVTDFLFKTVEGELIIFGIMFTGLSIAVSYSDKEKIDRLEDTQREKDHQIEELIALDSKARQGLEKLSIDTYQVLSLYLKQISEELGLGIDDRVSAYRVSVEHFSLIGRYSENQTYIQAGRKYYTKQEGLLAVAHEKSWAQAEMSCGYEGNSARRKKYTDEQLKRFRIPAQTVQGFRMKSRSYRAVAIKGHGLGHPIAIVCVESTARTNLNHIDRYVLTTKLGLLSTLLEALEHHIPSMDTAMSQGL